MYLLIVVIFRFLVAEIKHDEDMSEILLIMVPCIAVPIALALLFVIIWMCRKSKNNPSNINTKNPNYRGGTGGQLELSPLNAKMPVRAQEFPISSMRFVQELGEGAFGKVYKGELVCYPSDNAITKVAIKTLKENAAPKVQGDFRREVDLMTDLKHPNIVCLIGVCVREEPMCMLFEYMTHGDLHEYLIMHSPHSDVSVSDDEGTQQVLGHGDMLYIASQIAAGMEYLASHHFVHRDLAARNILVGDHLTVKISDFGLSRDIYSSDYYRVQSKSLLPVRWMPPESILYGKFTVESDVWSFGVVLWEIFSFGLQPYYGYTNQEVIEMIRARQILPRPEDCPPPMYSLMMECWNEVPSHRPAFRDIHTRLRSWKAEMLMNHHQQLNHQQLNHILNPALSAAAVSHSGQSSSTHHSNNSHHSHHSSTGPSNNTTTTGLTTSSQMSTGIMAQPQLQGNHHQRPINYPVPIPPPPMPYNQVQRPPAMYNMNGGMGINMGNPMMGMPPQMNQHPQYPGLYKKPSPPGSTASHKSSPVNSSASSMSNYRQNIPTSGKPIMNSNGNHMNYNHNSAQSPTSSSNFSKTPTSIPSSGFYIPDTRTSEI